ncbi:hypothetical protein PMI23_04851 [Pseudomonas sp. GM24]|jgi:hypothetical protein|uniref:Uncharacterized protein n=2 Tax=Pseudomonas TaxID=286 RepID=A0A423MUT2_PSEFL|nr:hypothetical protein PMI19_03999 [Pseudomonas sp. GM16]EJM30086.1 hypothetical protein PMI23_04851 [Pseudomonas sp. GM24]RON89136.1 hypothetical protein BK672_26560 [Pseudomonas fluorescens]
MTQRVVQTISRAWSRMGELSRLRTPSQRSEYIVEGFADDRVIVLVASKRHVLLRSAFEAALNYLHQHSHGIESPCLIKSNNDPALSGPLCRASRVTLSGAYGPRNINYVLPILQALGVVDIRTSTPNAVWLVTPLAANDLSFSNPVRRVGKGLLTARQFDFAQYLSGLWTGAAGSFSHRYKVSRHHSWKDWRARHGASDWWCQSLSQANQHYCWREKAAPHDFASIAAELRKSLENNDEAAALVACKAIFAWGGVARKADDASLQWVELQAAAKTLCRSIRRAVKLLDRACADPLDDFNGKTLLMNSAMTKIYAAAAPDSLIIYDGRVGAALGLLARTWLLANAERTVPTDLAFRWGPNTKTANQKDETRNPSQDLFIFTNLYTTSSDIPARNREWAELVRMSSRLLWTTGKVLDAQSYTVTLSMLERSLFMLGYDVR